MIPKPALAAAALVTVLGAGVAYQSLTSGHDETPTTESDPGPARTVTLDQAPSETPSPSTGQDDPGAASGPTTNERDVEEPQTIASAAQVASDAIVAYTQWSYLDPKQTSWIDRVTPYATDGFHHSLVEQFAAPDPYWDGHVVPEERETRTKVSDVVVDGLHDQTATKKVYTVTYENAIKTKDMNDWGSPEPVTVWVFLVKQGSTWKVDDIAPTGSRNSADF